MAHRLTVNILRIGLLLAGCALNLDALAQGDRLDPTRPPTGGGEALDEPVHGLVLQSVMIPGKGKPVAVIDGQQVKVGALFGEYRLVRVDEREAVLEGPEGILRLLLTPGVEKKSVAQKSAHGGSQNRGQR